MEDTLRDCCEIGLLLFYFVLILVLMEDTLRALQSVCNENLKTVLILVLMEDTLRAVLNDREDFLAYCLNPCFNGRYSQSCAHELISVTQ